MQHYIKKLYLLCKTQRHIFLQENPNIQILFYEIQQLFKPIFATYSSAKFYNNLLESQNNKSRFSLISYTTIKKQANMAVLSAIAAALFWLPLWSFILINTLGLWGNALLSIMCILCIFSLMKNKHQDNNLLKNADSELNKQSRKHIHETHKTTKNNSTVKKDSYILSLIINPLVVYILCLLLGILTLSFLHNNPYIFMSLFYPLSIGILLFIPRQYRFYLGFFIGIFGFYWMSLSLRFEEASLFIVPLTLCIGFIYGILFAILLFFNVLFFRIICILALAFIHPFGFNWLNLAFFSSYTVFLPSLVGLALLTLSLCLLTYRGKIAFIGVILVFFSYDYHFDKTESEFIANKYLKIIHTNYTQDYRWLQENQARIILDNFSYIDHAIQEHYPMILLPETSFPFSLNHNTKVFRALLEKSKDIIIFTGGLRFQEIENTSYTQNLNSLNVQQENLVLDSLNMQLNNKQQDFYMSSWQMNTYDLKPDSKILDLPNMNVNNSYKNPNEMNTQFVNIPNHQAGFYNSYYVFSYGLVAVADKVMLVPFGETLPFNKILSPVLERFDIEFGFNTGKELLSLSWKGNKITIANCYEATMPLPYQTGAKHIFVGSNNAWFYPSTQHFMQQMIMKYYARHYQSFVYHATNITPSIIITPNNGID